MTLVYVTVTQVFEGVEDDAVTVTLTPSQEVWAAGVCIIPAVPVRTKVVDGELLAADGTSLLQLLATDQDGLSYLTLTGFFTWHAKVEVRGAGTQEWDLALPSSPSTVELYATQGGGGPGGGTGGGFTSPMTTPGDLIVGGTDGVPERLAVNADETRKVLISAAGATALDTLETGDIPDLSELYLPAPEAVSPPPSLYAPLLYGGVWSWPWQFWGDRYMLMDARAVEDATVAGGALDTLTSDTDAWTSADVGRSLLVWTGSAWYRGTITARDSSTAVTVTPSFSGSFSGKGAVIGTDGVAGAQAWVDAALAYGQGGPQEAELYIPPLPVLWATPAVKGSGGVGGNAQLRLPMITPGAALPVSLVMRSDGQPAGPRHWEGTSRLLPGATIISTCTDGALDTTYGPPSVIGGPVAGMGGGGGLFSDCRVHFDGITIATPLDTGHYCGWDLYGHGQATAGSIAYVPLGQVPDDGGPWPVLDANAVSAYSFGARWPANGNNARCHADDLTVYGTQIGLIPSEHFDCRRLRTITGVFGVLPMSESGGTMSHGVSIGNWASEGYKYPLASVDSGYFALNSPIGIKVERLDIESAVAYVNDAAGRLYGEVGFGLIDSPGSYVTDTAYAAGTARGVRLRRLEAAPGPVDSPAAEPASGSDWENKYYRDAWITLSATTITGVDIDGVAQAGLASSPAEYAFMLPAGSTYTPTYTGTLAHTVSLS